MEKAGFSVQPTTALTRVNVKSLHCIPLDKDGVLSTADYTLGMCDGTIALLKKENVEKAGFLSTADNSLCRYSLVTPNQNTVNS